MLNSSLKKRLNDGIKTLEQQIEANIKNPLVNDQYKLLIDSAQKSEERRRDSNSIFITLNSALVPFLLKFYEIKGFDFKDILIFSLLIGLGIVLCISWLSIIRTFRNLNYINYLLIRTFEVHLPTTIFTLRGKILEPGFDYKKPNVVLQKETLIPFIFLAIYVLYYIISLWPAFK